MPADDDGPNVGMNETYYSDDDEESDKKNDDGKESGDVIEGDDKGRRRALLEEYKVFRQNFRSGTSSASYLRKLAEDESDIDEKPAPIVNGVADDDENSNNDDLAIFRNFVFGKCLSKGHTAQIPSTKAPVAVTRH